MPAPAQEAQQVTKCRNLSARWPEEGQWARLKYLDLAAFELMDLEA
jgi:hypothetical protein